jgi:hypothetical protein
MKKLGEFGMKQAVIDAQRLFWQGNRWLMLLARPIELNDVQVKQ